MKHTWCKWIILLLMAFLTVGIMTPKPASANSAEPPTLTIVLDDPFRKTTMTLYDEKVPIAANVIDTAWERQFRFFKLDLSQDKTYQLVITTPNKTHTITVPAIKQTYRTTYKFNPKTGTLEEGLPLWRSILLVSLRFTTTVLIEGLVFYLFLFRQKDSWRKFILLNVVTQGALNLWLNSNAYMGGYLIFALVIGEFFVFIVEPLFYATLMHEHSTWRRVLCALTANAASLILGGLLILHLPV